MDAACLLPPASWPWLAFPISSTHRPLSGIQSPFYDLIQIAFDALSISLGLTGAHPISALPALDCPHLDIQFLGNLVLREWELPTLVRVRLAPFLPELLPETSFNPPAKLPAALLPLRTELL